ncbi:MAG: DNA-directed RNA polymerase subunit beta' [Candidatus Doudnabacteria bacterium]
MSNITPFRAIKLKLASPEEILAWSYGEITRPETINYRTGKPEKDGLFCEKIFGPTKDWECYCGKYKRIRYKGVVCDKCGVEVTRSIVRRERMGHISLAVPVSHIWFLRGVPSKVGLVLNLGVQSLEKVVYFASYIITKVYREAREKARVQINKELKVKREDIIRRYKEVVSLLKQEKGKALSHLETKSKRAKIEAGFDQKIIAKHKEREKALEELSGAVLLAQRELASIKRLAVISELQYRNFSLKYGEVFEAGIGAGAIRDILAKINLEKLAQKLNIEFKKASSTEQKRLKKRISLVEGMIRAKIRPEWMILTELPVIPPDLRPMVQLDGGRFAASDLNDLYRRIINRNNRLKRLQELNAPEVIRRNEKRMLQEAVDALIDNEARHGKVASSTTGQKRILRSVADMLKGKQGRFRQNLLGKRVDYSGRSVIVVGPKLKLHQCGIPKKMALELFKPFVISKLIQKEYTHNVRSAGKLLESGTPEVWDILEEVIRDQYVLLNRAPTLHRLSIQAFKPILIEGKAIQIHPMVCSAFNADFDGDQMAVHVPLTRMAREEARKIMLSSRNLLKPATGEPITTASKDIVLGCYYMTRVRDKVKGEGKIFAMPYEALLAYEEGIIDIQALISVRIKLGERIQTSAGRIIFNQILPPALRFQNQVMDKKALKNLIDSCLKRYGRQRAVKLIDDIKDIGFEYLTRSGLSWGMNDLQIPARKGEILKKADIEVDQIYKQFKEGLLTDEERYTKVLEIWTRTKDFITKEAGKAIDKYGPLYSMLDSGARGSWSQASQMIGMKGLVANPAGKTIELPVKDSFKEGFSVLEYFISTHGTRKGMSDTALRTATAGYLTRRLVDVAQDMVVRDGDCGDTKGLLITREETEEMGETIAKRVTGRTSLTNLRDPKTGEIIVKKGDLIDEEQVKKIAKIDPDEFYIRSSLTCKTVKGICQKCYGWDLGHKQLVKLGEAVGIIAAQSIGEPGTQLTMRTFHTGGVAEGDIIQGLPRVEGLFECRPVKNPAVMAEVDGIVDIENRGDKKIVRIFTKDIITDRYSLQGKKARVENGSYVEAGEELAVSDKGQKIKAKATGIVKIQGEELSVVREQNAAQEHLLPLETPLWVEKGQEVAKGDQLTEGYLDLRKLFKVSGAEAVQKYIIREVQRIYSTQGQDINDKHIEIITRQMFSKVSVENPGDSDFIPGAIMDKLRFEHANQVLKKQGREEITGEHLLLGITKASLNTESFLSAASFQETARVLIEAAVMNKEDKLEGLKENVIIGRLIPAGTGFRRDV